MVTRAPPSVSTKDAHHALVGYVMRQWRWLRKPVFARDIVLAIVLKIALVAALYVLLMRPAFHPAQDPVSTAAAITGAGTAAAREVSR